ncbi:MAG TPA: MerR family transcriptional regulator, partial [Candidatus Nitrosotenuis sp.]|nr:MerR family transcriptional regulator [Candidatus Nitrosotenuis sp.]
MSVGEATWTLDELTATAEQELRRLGVASPGGRVSEVLTGRTVRHYQTLGLVERPLGYQGGVARYGRRHLLQLLAIRALQAAYLPLPEIQRRLYGRSDDELGQIVESASRRGELTARWPGSPETRASAPGREGPAGQAEGDSSRHRLDSGGPASAASPDGGQTPRPGARGPLAAEEAPAVQAWTVLRPVPGLLLAVEDRQALARWLGAHPPQEIYRRLEQALGSLLGPQGPGGSPAEHLG